MSTVVIEDFIHAVSTMPLRPSPEAITEATTAAIHFLLRRNMLTQGQNDQYIGSIDVFDTSTRFCRCRPRATGRELDPELIACFPFLKMSNASLGVRAVSTDMRHFSETGISLAMVSSRTLIAGIM